MKSGRTKSPRSIFSLVSQVTIAFYLLIIVGLGAWLIQAMGARKFEELSNSEVAKRHLQERRKHQKRQEQRYSSWDHSLEELPEDGGGPDSRPEGTASGAAQAHRPRMPGLDIGSGSGMGAVEQRLVYGGAGPVVSAPDSGVVTTIVEQVEQVLDEQGGETNDVADVAE